METYVRGKRVKVRPSASIGKGGEADVFDLGGGVALKLWKGPDHPDLAGDTEAMARATERLQLAQQKMPAFPANLPARVIAPLDLATDSAGRIVGYTMPLVVGADVLLRCADPGIRRALGGAAATRILLDLLATVTALHHAGVTIGDFNDLNVLVRGTEAFLVDADSFQFGPFACSVFTERFVDPLLCDPAAARPLPVRPFGPASDRYAFAVMLMQTLLCVGPHGGVHRPADPSRRVPEAARPLRRITVFHPEVRYPKPAIPYGVLPDDLLHELSAIFEKDARGPFPAALLSGLRWTHCAGCGTEHARARCPVCDRWVPREVTVVRGRVTATRIFSTRGTIVTATLCKDAPAWVVHEDGAYRREDGAIVLRGPLDPALSFSIEGRATLIGRGERVIVIEPGRAPEELRVDTCAGRPVLALNTRGRVLVQGGRLLHRTRKDTAAAPLADGAAELIGEVLAGQTRIWVGERLGFGFYRAGNLSVAFTFIPGRRGILDTVRIPWPSGQIVDAHAVLDADRAWFFLAHEQGGRILHRAAVIGADGALLATAEGEAGDGTWLGALRGKCAIGGALLSATDAGLVRVEVQGGVAETVRLFADTEAFTDAHCEILAGPSGLWVVDSREIRRLALG
jgi:hypothetical protein